MDACLHVNFDKFDECIHVNILHICIRINILSWHIAAGGVLAGIGAAEIVGMTSLSCTCVYVCVCVYLCIHVCVYIYM